MKKKDRSSTDVSTSKSVLYNHNYDIRRRNKISIVIEAEQLISRHLSLQIRKPTLGKPTFLYIPYFRKSVFNWLENIPENF